MKDKLSKNINWTILLVAVIALFFAVNYMLDLIPNMSVDMTTEKLYTLSDTTKEVLKELDQSIEIYALYDRTQGEEDTGNGGQAEIIRILDLYDAYKNVSVSYVDLDRKPSFLADTVGETNATLYSEGDYIVKCGDSTRRIQEDDLYSTASTTYNYQTYTYAEGLQAETKFTSAILKVTSETPKFYCSIGFSEQSISYYSTLVDYLDSAGYDIDTINLTTNPIPDDCATLIFFGPEEDLTDEAYDKVERWLKKGNSAYFFMDIKGIDGDTIYDDMTNFNKLFANYGITIENTIVSESGENLMSNTGDNVINKVTTSSAGAFESLEESLTLYTIDSRSMILDNMSDTCEAEAMIKTSTKAVSESITSENETRTGEAILAASGKCYEGSGTSQICVFGSSKTFYDTALKYYGTSSAEEAIMTTLSWMNIENKENVGDSIQSKSYENTLLTSYINTTDNQAKTIVIIAFVIPLIILIIGIVIAFIRRRL